MTTKFFPLAFLLVLFKPKIAVDGYEVPSVGWGRTVVPGSPGRHHVRLHTPYFLPPRLGPADTTVDVHPGRIAELEYKAPLFAFSPGRSAKGRRSTTEWASRSRSRWCRLCSLC